MKVLIIGEVHYVTSCQKDEGATIEAFCPDLVMLEMIPSGREFDQLCSEFNSKQITIHQFQEKSELDHSWGPFLPYEPLFDSLQKSNIALAPLDHSLESRQRLARLEKEIVQKFKNDLDIESLIRRERFMIFQEREIAFSQNLLSASEQGFRKIVLVLGANHLDRMLHLANLMRITEVKGVNLALLHSSASEEILDQDEANRILQMETPPLVLINSLLYREVYSKLIMPRYVEYSNRLGK